MSLPVVRVMRADIFSDYSQTVVKRFSAPNGHLFTGGFPPWDADHGSIVVRSEREARHRKHDRCMGTRQLQTRPRHGVPRSLYGLNKNALDFLFSHSPRA